MARRKKSVARMHQLAQLKIRLPEWLRFKLEREAADADRSMNAEIVRRLASSVQGGGQHNWAGVVAEAIWNGLDPEIAKRLEDIVLSAAGESAADLMSMYSEEENAQDDAKTPKGE
jgi:hypothetical protein